MKNLEFREARTDEFDSIYQLGRDAWGEGLADDEYLKRCRKSPKYKKGKWYVLIHNNEIKSSLIVYKLRPKSFGIGSIATSTLHRKQGFASRLIAHVVKQLATAEDIAVFLYSDINPEFYEKFGFKKIPQNGQRYKKSVCMVYGRNPEEFSNHSKTPDYF